MRAVVLVGGFGTRLRPLTDDTPKQMLPIVHRPMIERVVAHLAAHGVVEAVLALGYRPDAFVDAYPDGECAGVRLRYAVEDDPLDTAGAIRFAALDAGFDGDRLVVVNGDVLTDLDVSAFLAFHERAGAEATIALHRVDDPSAFGVVPTDDTGRVLAFVEKPPPGRAPSDFINAGTYVLEPAALRRIPDGRASSIEREVFPAIAADRTLFAVDGNAYWVDAGTPATYLQSQLDLIDGTRGVREDGIHDGALIDPAASVGAAVVGDAATVAAGATVERSVLLTGATVAPGATVRDSIIGASAIVGAGATVDGLTVVGTGVHVPAGSVLHGAKVPEPAA